MGEHLERFPLFPLGLVLLPGETVPLHIFEERYKTMIGECLERESEFGILWMGDDGLRDVGCCARIDQLLEEMDDGRMNILVRGSRPFRLERRIDDMEYPAGDVELLDEHTGEADEELAATARESYSDLVEQVTDSTPDEEDLDGPGGLRHGRHDRVRPRRQAEPAGDALRERPAGPPQLTVRGRARAFEAR